MQKPVISRDGPLPSCKKVTRYLHYYTVSHKKTCHLVFGNNSGVSWSIFILFVPIETGRNTLQFTYLMA